MRVRDLVLEGVQDVAVHALGEDVDLGGRELARADLLLEEQVELGKGAALRLGHAEVAVDEAEEAEAGLRGSVRWDRTGVGWGPGRQLTQKKPA